MFVAAKRKILAKIAGKFRPSLCLYIILDTRSPKSGPRPVTKNP